jgi:Plasmid pRiA4b ORF-3-like protein
MIWTIKVTLLTGAYATSECVRVFEMDSATCLDDLHFLIQRTLRFDNDHLYDFFVARTPRSRDRILIDNENGELDSTTLADLFPLPKNRKLFYYFDYGDSWIFEVSRTRRAPFAPLPGTDYPVSIEKIGKNPKQYG